MITKNTNELISVVRRALEKRNISKVASNLLIEDHVGAEVNGKVTHGVAKLLLLDDLLDHKSSDPEVAVDMGSFISIEGNGSLGASCAGLAIELATQRAMDLGVAIVSITNFSRYGRLSVIGREFAKRGFISIVMNNGGPPAVPSPGCKEPILGTNPICFAFPNDPIVVMDLATSERPWGAIRQSMLEGRRLPEAAFLDKDGSPTTEPTSANAVLPISGHKGFALGAAIELLCGAMVPAKTGLRVDTQFDLGSLMFVLKPDIFRSLDSYGEEIASLANDVAASTWIQDSQKRPRLPGTAELSLDQIGEDHEISLEDTVWEAIVRMAEGSRSPMSLSKLND